MNSVDINAIEEKMKAAALDQHRGYAQNHYGEVQQSCASLRGTRASPSPPMTASPRTSPASSPTSWRASRRRAPAP
ncbi:hypothetical protein HYQ46_006383 [Verticillium longisporum]|nr:hypothetical protein HYQ46_006383 [Verticillium longisporum]